MTKPPHLYRDPEPENRDDLRLDIAVGSGRRRLELSDRVVSLLVDDLECAPPECVPSLRAGGCGRAGGATLGGRAGKGERDPSGRRGGADGGREPTTTDLERLASYLEAVEVPSRSLKPLRELVRSTRLSEACDPEDLQDRSERVNRLRDIATDL